MTVKVFFFFTTHPTTQPPRRSCSPPGQGDYTRTNLRELHERGPQSCCEHDDINAEPIPQSTDISHLHEGGGICMLALMLALTRGSLMSK